MSNSPLSPQPLDPDMHTQELRLHMGELTDREVRVARAAIRWANTHLREQAAQIARLQAAQDRIDGILRDYADELDKAACDRCENCGPVGMCGFHSVLSIAAGHSWPTSAPPDAPKASA